MYDYDILIICIMYKYKWMRVCVRLNVLCMIENFLYCQPLDDSLFFHCELLLFESVIIFMAFFAWRCAIELIQVSRTRHQTYFRMSFLWLCCSPSTTCIRGWKYLKPIEGNSRIKNWTHFYGHILVNVANIAYNKIIAAIEMIDYC